MLEILIVRHGESVRNRACFLAHHGEAALLDQQLHEPFPESQWPLTTKGQTQAQTAGAWLLENVGFIDALYCSPYVRTVETALALDLGIKPIIDTRLREREWGEYPAGGYTVGEYLQDLSSCCDFEWRSRFPSAESILDLVPSTAAFLRDVKSDHPTGRVVIVTHGGRMQAMERVVENDSCPRRYANCSVLRYRFDGEDVDVRVDFPAQPAIQSVPWAPIRSTVAV